MFASEYGWTEDEVLDKPFFKLREYAKCIKVRKFTTVVMQLRTMNMAQGASQEQFIQFIEEIKPKEPQPDTKGSVDGRPVGQPVVPMDLSCLNLCVPSVDLKKV